jgi:hypothetical protein
MSESSGVARTVPKSRYWVRLYQAVPGTNTRWRRLTEVQFETDEPVQNVSSAVVDIANDFVTEEETEGPGSQMTSGIDQGLPSGGPVAELQGFSRVRGGMFWPW